MKNLQVLTWDFLLRGFCKITKEFSFAPIFVSLYILNELIGWWWFLNTTSLSIFPSPLSDVPEIQKKRNDHNNSFVFFFQTSFQVLIQKHEWVSEYVRDQLVQGFFSSIRSFFSCSFFEQNRQWSKIKKENGLKWNDYIYRQDQNNDSIGVNQNDF